MRIHVVSRDLEGDQILARLAGVLLAHEAFSGGASPDPTADANLFFPYLEWDRFRAFHDTPTAAFFSHRDDGRDEKVAIWRECAAAVDLRLVSTRLHVPELKERGATGLLVPPLDREHFQMKARCLNTPRRVGTSGYVYPGGRKGEKLFGALAQRWPQLEFVALGRGWPVPTQHVAWEEVPDFYGSLDVYVCTSLIEGIGYGPLEAMACGIPVVIPRNVGIFDDLPDLENLHRYEAGNLEALSEALGEALSRLNENSYNPASLRGATARFTKEAWAASFLAPFEHLLYDVEYQPPPEQWRGRAGVYYVAYGKPARECAERAIASFKKYMPGVEVALVSDAPLDAGEDIFIEHEDADIGGRSVKTRIYDLAPAHWEYVMYLDADTEVVADISFLFQVLEDGWELAICLNPNRYVTTADMRRPDNEEECNETYRIMGHDDLLQLNGGVFSFRRCSQTERFFRRWHEEWRRWGARDQAALLRVL